MPGAMTLASTDSVEQVIAVMAAAWRRGEREPAETWLQRQPDLLACSENAVRIIYEEVCLRQELGESVRPEEILERFPQWREELALVLDCHHLFLSRATPAQFPEVGQRLGDFRLIAELGRGSTSRVFLATQSNLADRPVVLKVSPRRDQEHLSLARLQQTHIIPLHALYDFPGRNLIALCQPYLGGATLAQILELLARIPPTQRTGQSWMEALEAVDRMAPVRLATRGGLRQFLSRLSSNEVVCYLGACLAEALHYAHERGLVHLDLKPSNVLLSADGQPLLLDFHLALPPLQGNQVGMEGLGGTPGFMAPEQERACAAVRMGHPIPEPVDGRADLYALGRLMELALSTKPDPGLTDILRRCTATDPSNRYPHAAAVATDLRRHLNHLPLLGVPNRSLRERWRKWRRRSPQGLLWIGLLLALFAGGIPLLVTGLERWQNSRPPGETRAAAETTRAQTGGPGADPARDRLALPQPIGGESREPLALAQVRLRGGQLNEAAAILEQVVDQWPQEFQAHFLSGVCSYRRNRFDDAVHSFDIAVALAPASAEPYYNRALAQAARGRPQLALRDYDRALERVPRMAEALLNRGVIHYQEGRYPESQTDLTQALDAGADPATTHYNLALVHLARGNPSAARESVQQALRHAPGHPQALDLRRRL